MAESTTAADYLRRFAAWRDGYARPGSGAAATPGIEPAGDGLPVGVSPALPADQDTLYIVLSGTGACWQPGPSVNVLRKIAPAEWRGSYPGGHVGRCEIDEFVLSGDSTATLVWMLNGAEKGRVDLVNGIGGGAATNCGCGQVTAWVYA